MLFNSIYFIVFFLPITAFVYFVLIKFRFPIGRKVWLVSASLFFYSFWNVAYLPLIVFSLLVNFYFGRVLAQLNSFYLSRKTILWLGITFNLLLLGYFKYANFFIDNFNHFLTVPIHLGNIVLPLAISFFTFQQIAYLVDSYQGQTHEYDILNYSLFVTFFPQLIAGPIVHHKEMMPQFQNKWNLLPVNRNIIAGLGLFSLGLFKKVMIADTFSGYVDEGFTNPHDLEMLGAWLTSLSYSMQLYFDFSGYCDMALGIALLFNIKLPLNFNSPYKALDIQDFWRRWHITLGRFLRDYIYIPLGGNRVSSARTLLALFVTFLIGGIWHGASWMFVLWGSLHGIALVIHRLWKKFGVVMPTLMAWTITFLFVNTSWIFFRAEDLTTALQILFKMIDVTSLNPDLTNIAVKNLAWLGPNADWLADIMPTSLLMNLDLFLLTSLTFCLIFFANAFEIVNRKESVSLKRTVTYAFLFAISMAGIAGNKSSVFLYFNF